MNRRRVMIGKYEEVSLQSVKDNAFEYYIPLASSTMTTDELQKYRNMFQAQIDAWVSQLSGSTNATEIANISEIINIQTARLADYDALLLQRLPVTTNGETLEPVQPTEKKSWLPIILIGVAAIYFFTRKKKRA